MISFATVASIPLTTAGEKPASSIARSPATVVPPGEDTLSTKASATKIAAQMVKGSAEMVLKSDEIPYALIDKVSL